MNALGVHPSKVPKFIVAVALFCFGCAILVSLVFFVCKCGKFSKENTVSILMITFAILASICYALSSILDGVYWVHLIYFYDYKFLGNLCDYIQTLFWYLGQIMVYCYLLFRLYKGFQGTLYKVKLSILVILIGLLCCYILVWLVIFGLMMRYILYYYNTNDATVHNLAYDNEFEVLYRAVTLGIDFVLSVSLLSIFINKLRKVSESLKIMVESNDVLKDEALDTDPLLDNDIKDKTLANQNENIYNVMSKVLILGVIMIIASQVVLMLSLANWMMNEYQHDTLTIVYTSLKGLHTVIASLSVFLGFEFAHNWYMKCCNTCHTRIKSWYMTRNNPKIEDSTQ